MASLVATARCLRCDWTEPAGDPVAVDRAAAKHWRQAGHPVATVTEAVR